MEIRMKFSEMKVCRFCDMLAGYVLIGNMLTPYCENCEEYKGLISIEQWENETGMEFEV